GRITDPDGGGNSFRIGDGGTVNQRGGTGRLEAVDDRGCAPLLETLPVSGDVTGIADRDREGVRGRAELINQFKSGRFLAFDPVRVDRVDQFDRIAFRELADD